jgi:hypothetical protein
VVTENLDTDDVEVQNVKNYNLVTGTDNENKGNINEIIEETPSLFKGPTSKQKKI